MGFAPPYFLRLRVAAKYASIFYKRLRELDPVYDDCPGLCSAPERDRVNNCPTCPYREAEAAFKKGYYKSLTKRLRRDLEDRKIPEEIIKGFLTPASLDYPVSFETIVKDYRTISEIEALAGAETEEKQGGYNLKWNVREATAVSIIREERYKFRRAENWEREQELKDRERAERLKRGK